MSVPERNDIEVLVVDNSSKPIDKYLFINRRNVKVLFSDNTKGAGHARNVGVDISKGKWLLFLDADDFFTVKAFSIFDKYLKANSDIIFFKMTSCYSDTLQPAKRHENYANFIDNYFVDKDEYSLRFLFSVPWSKMIKSSHVRSYNIRFEEVPASNDVIFALKLGITAKSISADLSEVYCVTINKASITKTTSLRNIESQFDVRIRKNKLLKENGLKKDSSVMFLILKSRKYGFNFFVKLLIKAIISKNLFVGYNNWIKTTFKLWFSSNINDKRYESIEK
jgi:glycosyltransferase involved in cell wall biosynthesis